MKKNNFPNYKIIAKLLRKKIESKMLEEEQKKVSAQLQDANLEQNIEEPLSTNNTINEPLQQLNGADEKDAIPLTNENNIDVEQIKPIESVEQIKPTEETDQAQKTQEDATLLTNENINPVEQIKPIEEIANNVEDKDRYDKIINPLATPASNVAETNSLKSNVEKDEEEPIINRIERIEEVQKDVIDKINKIENANVKNDREPSIISRTRFESPETPQLYNDDVVDATPISENKENKLIDPLAIGAVSAAVSNNMASKKQDAEKQALQTTNNKDQPSILSSIADNLVEVNKSIENILTFKKNETADEKSTLTKAFSDKDVQKDGVSQQQSKNDSSIWSTVLKTLGIGLFLIAPALIRFIKEKADSIKKVFEPVFEFMSDALNFILNDIPDFFVNDIPNFFVDKFKSLQEKAQYFINSASIMISEIKKNAGEIIVALGEKIKDLPFDVAKEVGQSIVNFGQELVDDANASIDAATLENDDIEKTNELEKVAENYAKELKQKDKNIKDATVIIDREKGVFNIELNYNEGEKKIQKLDFYESMRRGKIIPLAGEEEPISDINELLGVGKRSAYSDRAAAGASRADAVSNVNALIGSATERPAQKVQADMSALNASIQMSQPDAVATPSSKSPLTSDSGISSGGETSSSGASMGGGGAAASPAPTAVPVSSGEQQPGSMPTANIGQTISDESLKATDPSLDVTNKQMQQSSGSSRNISTPKSSKPKIDRNWSIDVVPDPSIAFGSLAEDLFYIRA